MYRFIIINLFLAFTAVLQAQELVYTDAAGTIRWKKNKQEVSLFGANYCLPSACDFRAAAYMRGDRKQMIAEYGSFQTNELGCSALMLLGRFSEYRPRRKFAGKRAFGFIGLFDC